MHGVINISHGSILHPVFNKALVQFVIVICSLFLPILSQQIGECTQGYNTLTVSNEM